MFKDVFKSKEPVDAIGEAHEANVNHWMANARAMATRQLPAQDGLGAAIAPMRAAYQDMGAVHIKELAGDHEKLAQREQAKFEKRRESLEKEAERMKQEERALGLRRDNLPPVKVKKSRRKWLYLLLLILALGDAVTGEAAMSVYNAHDNFKALVLFVVLTVVFALVPHFFMAAFRGAHTPGKWVVRAVAVMVIIAGFGIIGYMRIGYTQNQKATTLNKEQVKPVEELPAWMFMGLAVFFLASSIYVVHELGTAEDRRNEERINELDEKLAAMKGAIKRSQDELDGIDESIYLSERAWATRKAEADSARVRIASLFLVCAHGYASENLLNRNDITSFDHEIQPLY